MKKILKRMRPLLGTFVEIGCIDTHEKTEIIIEDAFKAIEEIHSLMSMQDPKSEISRINCSLGMPVRVNTKTSALIRISRYISYRTNGNFDITVGGHLINRGLLPNHQNLNYKNQSFGDEFIVKKGLIRVPKEVAITLDGIAKGFAVDQAVKTLKKKGILNGWVNAGGDLRVFGDIDFPLFRKEANGTHSFLGNISNAAVASSIINTKQNDRYPSLIVSKAKLKYNTVVSVKASTCLLADALTKVAASGDQNEALKIIGALGGVVL